MVFLKMPGVGTLAGQNPGGNMDEQNPLHGRYPLYERSSTWEAHARPERPIAPSAKKYLQKVIPVGKISGTSGDH